LVEQSAKKMKNPPGYFRAGFSLVMRCEEANDEERALLGALIDPGANQ